MVTGGAGFIGGALCRLLIRSGHRVVNVDALTYAGNLQSLRDVAEHPCYSFHQADVRDRDAMLGVLRQERVDLIAHLAAETHVDRSIDGPEAFLDTNVRGTVQLLQASLGYWRSLDEAAAARFRFLQVSTDEVFGELPIGGKVSTETSPYLPRSPYAASKAAADHFARAWAATYGLPVLLTRSSNNYGPFQFPEKLVPLTILNAFEGRPLPVYGKGRNVRDWLHVDDHARALEAVLLNAKPGMVYNIGGRSERTNLAVVETICDALDERGRLASGIARRDLITFVADRPGHDLRYAVDPAKIERELGWRAEQDFDGGIRRTIDWFCANEWWWRPIRERSYAGARLGLAR